MTALKKIAGPRMFLLAGDSKLISWANATAMAAAQVTFIAPLAASRVPAGLFAALPAGAGTTVDYVAARDAGKPAARASYRVLEDDGTDLHGPAKPTRWYTRAGSWCTPQRTSPARPRPGRTSWPGPRRNWTSWSAPPGPGSTRTQRVAMYLRTAITAGPAGKPVLAWHFDQDAIDADAAGDGWYALLTNLVPGQALGRTYRHARRVGAWLQRITASSRPVCGY